MSIQVLCPFQLDSLVLATESYKFSLYILDVTSLPDIWFANIFPILKAVFHLVLFDRL